MTPTSEVSIIDSSDPKKWWKLIVLAGASNYYSANSTQIMDKCDGSQVRCYSMPRYCMMCSPLCNLCCWCWC